MSFNDRIIEEFRQNRGQVGEPFADETILLLTVPGARTGVRRTVPLAYAPKEGRLFVFAAHRGAPKTPDWFHNVVAHPDVEVELGTERHRATAQVLRGPERERIWTWQVERRPVFVRYRQQAGREIPILELQLRSTDDEPR